MESKIDKYRKRLFEAQEITVKIEAEDGATEDQILKRCAELRNQIINAESMNNRFKNQKLHAIWNSPPRFKKL